MPLFFMWGNELSSWLVANESRIEFNNLPSSYGIRFTTNELNGMNVAWAVSGGDGVSVIRLIDGRTVTPPSLYHVSHNIEHIAISSWGGYWIKFENNTVYTSRDPVPPSLISFTRTLPLRDNSYQYVFFGFRDAYLYRFTTGHCGWGGADLPQDLKDKCAQMMREGWVLGKNTALCPYDAQYYFVHWQKGIQNMCSYKVPRVGELSNELVGDVILGKGRNLQVEKNFEDQVRIMCESAIEQNRVVNQFNRNITAIAFGNIASLATF